MTKVRLDALEKAGRTGSLAVEIHWHAEPFFEKKLEVHETCKGGRRVEINEEIEIVRLGVATCGGSKQPKLFNTKCSKLGPKVLNGEHE
jgi:hypothetical protein